MFQNSAKVISWEFVCKFILEIKLLQCSNFEDREVEEEEDEGGESAAN